MVVSEPEPLHLHFGHYAARICCTNTEARAYVHRHFRHCAGARSSVVAVYRLDVDADRLVSVQRDAEQAYFGSLSPYLIEWLMQDLTRVLTTPCSEDLIVHAAGLAWGMAGIVLCGASGSGKSTLAAWLVSSGFDFLSDELIGLAPDGAQMTGFPRPIGLKAGSAFVWEGRVSEAAQPGLLRISDQLTMLDPDLLRAGCVRAATQPAYLLFPRYQPDAPFCAERLSPAAALFRLLQRVLNAKNLPAHGSQVAGRVVRQLPAYEVTYSDLSEVQAWLAVLRETHSPLSDGV